MNFPRQNKAEQIELKKSDLLSSGWSCDARKNAYDRLLRTGFPTSRDEYWKYTNPVTLTKKNVDKSVATEDQAGDIFVSFLGYPTSIEIA